MQKLSVISGFRRDADDICALLGYNASSSRNHLPTFLGQRIGSIFKGQEVQVTLLGILDP
jgi:hypothetical protein